jgi:hypothetical protein
LRVVVNPLEQPIGVVETADEYVADFNVCRVIEGKNAEATIRFRADE